MVESNASSVSVEYQGMGNKTGTTCVVPDTVKVNGIDCKVVSIKAKAFYNQKKLTSVTVADSVTKIGDEAFSGCSSLKKAVIGDKVTEIGKKAFYKTTSLKKVTIPASVKKIGASAFGGAKRLKTITIKTKQLTKKTVGKKAFQNIHPKAKIKVPSKKRKAYVKLLKSKGLPAKATIK